MKDKTFREAVDKKFNELMDEVDSYVHQRIEKAIGNTIKPLVNDIQNSVMRETVYTTLCNIKINYCLKMLAELGYIHKKEVQELVKHITHLQKIQMSAPESIQ